MIILSTSILLASCSAESDKPKSLGLSNPASVYCLQVGGKLEIINEDKGQVGYCTLPNGERIEEWSLYRKENP